MKVRSNPLITVAKMISIIVFSVIIFAAGAVAMQKCLWPFCRGYSKFDFSTIVLTPPEKNIAPVAFFHSQFLDGPIQIFDLKDESKYGDLSYFDGHFFYIDQAGRLFVLDHSGHSGDILDNIISSDEIPNNREEFRNFLRNMDRLVYDAWFGVKGLELKRVDGKVFSYALSSYFDPDKKCVQLALFRKEILSTNKTLWEKLFLTTPCVTDFYDIPTYGSRLGSVGGKVKSVDDTRLLLTVGDSDFDGLTGPELVTSDSTHFGKTLLVDNDGKFLGIFTRGHRGPQGLLVTPEGIYESEHGPSGGDELNLLEQDADYGWPRVTYGTDYGKKVWPPSPTNGRHDGYRQPLFSWTPSIAASGLTMIRCGAECPWDRNIFLSTLYAKTLFRVTLAEGRVVTVEPIPIGYRIRSITFGGKKIVFKTDPIVGVAKIGMIDVAF